MHALLVLMHTVSVLGWSTTEAKYARGKEVKDADNCLKDGWEMVRYDGVVGEREKE